MCKCKQSVLLIGFIAVLVLASCGEEEKIPVPKYNINATVIVVSDTPSTILYSTCLTAESVISGVANDGDEVSIEERMFKFQSVDGERSCTGSSWWYYIVEEDLGIAGWVSEEHIRRR